MLITALAVTSFCLGACVDPPPSFRLVGIETARELVRDRRASLVEVYEQDSASLPAFRGVRWRVTPDRVPAPPELPDGPVLVIATIGLAIAILTEATLSFLGVGVPPTQPSLGTLIRVGNNFLLSGEWWMTIFPGAALVTLVLSINLLGDWLRDYFNPKLR